MGALAEVGGSAAKNLSIALIVILTGSFSKTGLLLKNLIIMKYQWLLSHNGKCWKL
ncbi:hypothetical protein LYNGBM3L_50930 [Moorena producens 3L]|uniref:Uncharacterized protein n=1 Tax=Moorena producens 3L TaxID=489825 RepID=F4XYC6_9CYAN|nr:hypothetical protein LYNGBM3L_50930 [Moorena producens 3L]